MLIYLVSSSLHTGASSAIRVGGPYTITNVLQRRTALSHFPTISEESFGYLGPQKNIAITKEQQLKLYCPQYW